MWLSRACNSSSVTCADAKGSVHTPVHIRKVVTANRRGNSTALVWQLIHLEVRALVLPSELIDHETRDVECRVLRWCNHKRINSE